MRLYSLSSFTFTLLLSYTVNMNNNYPNNLRVLEELDIKEKACANPIQNYEKITNFETLESYVASLNIKSNIGEELIQNFPENLGDFILSLVLYLVMFGFSGITLILLPTFCICCCCDCVLFKRSVRTDCLGIVSFVITLLIYSWVIICSSIGISLINKYILYFDSSSCSFITFFDNISEGVTTTTLPKWAGTKSISSRLNSYSSSLNAITDIYNTNYLNDQTHQELLSQKDKLFDKYEDLTSFYSPVDNEDVGFQCNNCYYEFVKEFDPSKKTNTNYYIGILFTERDSLIEYNIDQLTNFGNKAKDIMDNSAVIEVVLPIFANKWEQWGITIESISDSVVKNFVGIQLTWSWYLKIIFTVFYSTFLAASCLILILINIYTWKRVFFLKTFLHILWTISLIWTIFGFLMAGCTGIIGYVSNIIPPVINYLLSDAYLSSPTSVFNGDAVVSNNINICLNTDGDLSSNLGNERKNMVMVKDWYVATRKIIQIENDLSSVRTSPVMDNVWQKLKTYEADLTKATSVEFGLNTIKDVLDDWNSKIREDFPGNHDMFVVKEDDCHVKPAKTFPESDLDKPNQNNCYFIHKTANKPNYSNYSSPLLDNAYKYTRHAFLVLTNIEIELGDLHSDNDTREPWYKEYFKTVEKIKEQVKAVDTVTELNMSWFGDIVGAGDFFDIFNCNFVRYDLITFFDQFSTLFSKTSKIWFDISAAISFLTLIGIVFYIITIYRYSSIGRGMTYDIKEKLKGIMRKDGSDNWGKIDDGIVKYQQLDANSRRA